MAARTYRILYSNDGGNLWRDGGQIDAYGHEAASRAFAAHMGFDDRTPVAAVPASNWNPVVTLPRPPADPSYLTEPFTGPRAQAAVEEPGPQE